MRRLPNEATSPAGRSDDEVAEELDRAFSDTYGIHVDEFLALRYDADTAATERFGDPPGLGELVSDEWFAQRDAILLMLWNERHPTSARAYCELIGETGQ